MIRIKDGVSKDSIRSSTQQLNEETQLAVCPFIIKGVNAGSANALTRSVGNWPFRGFGDDFKTPFFGLDVGIDVHHPNSGGNASLLQRKGCFDNTRKPTRCDRDLFLPIQPG